MEGILGRQTLKDDIIEIPTAEAFRRDPERLLRHYVNGEIKCCGALNVELIYKSEKDVAGYISVEPVECRKLGQVRIADFLSS